VRAEELKKLSADALLKSVAAHPKEWISNNKLVLLASLILKAGSGKRYFLKIHSLLSFLL